MEKLRNRVHKAEQSVQNLTVKVLKLTSQGERLDRSFQSDYPDGSFARLVWDEQFKAASATDIRQVRWHPVIIKYEITV